MRLEEMELLVRVSEAGSMTRAGKQLGLTVAAVSASVRRVEAETGLRIFERTTRSLKPTDEGVLLLEGCRDVLLRWEAALERSRDQSAELVGEVHLSVPSDTAQHSLADLAVSLSDAHPRLRLVLHISDTVQHLHREAIDVAVRYGPLADTGLIARRLAATPGILVASPEYVAAHGLPGSPEALSRHRCLTLSLASLPVTAWTLAGHPPVELDSPLCADGLTVRRWALDGAGIAFKALFDVIHDLEAGRLVHVLSPLLAEPIPVHAVFPSRRFRTARVRAVTEALVENFAARQARCEAWLLSARAPR